MGPALFHKAEDCVGCGRCEEVCPYEAIQINNGKATVDRNRCTSCGGCVDVCPRDTFSLEGKEITVGEVVSEVLKDRAQYANSGGGMTLSGGDPLAQHQFTLALLIACKEKGIHTVVETCGYADQAIVREIAPYTDIFFYDIKTLDNKKHIEGTGVENRLILENAAWIARSGKKITLRMPMIPGFNDNEQDVKGLLAFAKDLGLGTEDVALLKYNPLGEVKYNRLGRENEKESWRLIPRADEYFDYLTKLLQ